LNVPHNTLINEILASLVVAIEADTEEVNVRPIHKSREDSEVVDVEIMTIKEIRAIEEEAHLMEIGEILELRQIEELRTVKTLLLTDLMDSRLILTLLQ